MLSGQLKRQHTLKAKLRAQAQSKMIPDEKTSTATITQQLKADDSATPPVVFKSAGNILINGDSVSVNIPTPNKGWLWDTWQNKTYTFPNNAEGVSQFIIKVVDNSTAIDNRINKYDAGVATVQTITSFTTAIIQIVQAAVAGAAVLGTTENTDFQVTLAAFMAALAYFANVVSEDVTGIKTSAINFQTALASLQTSQSNDLRETPTIAPASPFVPVNNVVIDGKKVLVKLPTKNTGCTLTPWLEEKQDFPNTSAGFAQFKAALFARKTDLDNQTATYEKYTALIQAITSMSTTCIGIIQTAVVGAASLNTTNLKIFQIIIASVNASLAIGAKYASATVTDLRNNVVTYSGDVAQMLAAQIKP